jgi:hypothetical protein
VRSLPALALCVAFACSSNEPAPALDASVDASIDPGCPADWWDCDFQSRRTIEAASTGEALANFPLLVSLSASDLADVNPAGDDLRFIGSQGASLPYEIDTWDAGAGAQIWVRVPSMAADEPTSLTMYWNNAGAPAPTNAAEVWSDGYQGVWHLNQAPTEMAPDSTGNLNVGTPSATAEPLQMPGPIGSAIDFTEVESWIEVAHSASLDITGGAITVSAWAYLRENQTQDGGLVVKTDDTGYHYQLGIQSTELANFRALSDSQTYITGLSPLAIERWYYVVGVYDGSASTIYVNAHADNVATQSGPVVTVGEPLVIGRRALTDDRFFKGGIDEARVSSVARSAAWIRAEFLNVTGELVTLGQIEGI